MSRVTHFVVVAVVDAVAVDDVVVVPVVVAVTVGYNREA